MYILDVNDTYQGLENIICEAERGADDANFNYFDYAETEIEWHDDIDINFSTATVETYRKYFE
jgi:hypothetical protein